MAQRNVEELYPRAPRYTVQVSDNHIVRFAMQPKGSKAMHTRIVNLSESGMAFIVPVMSAPKDDEMIKVEFNAPHCEPIACYAKVVRVQKHISYNSHGQPQVFRMIAVEFQGLLEPQRRQLAEGLSQQFKKLRKNYEWEQFWLKLEWQVFSFFKLLVWPVNKLIQHFFPKKTDLERGDKYIND